MSLEWETNLDEIEVSVAHSILFIIIRIHDSKTLILVITNTINVFITIKNRKLKITKKKTRFTYTHSSTLKCSCVLHKHNNMHWYTQTRNRLSPGRESNSDLPALEAYALTSSPRQSSKSHTWYCFDRQINKFVCLTPNAFKTHIVKRRPKMIYYNKLHLSTPREKQYLLIGISGLKKREMGRICLKFQRTFGFVMTKTINFVSSSKMSYIFCCQSLGGWPWSGIFNWVHESDDCIWLKSLMMSLVLCLAERK